MPAIRMPATRITTAATMRRSTALDSARTKVTHLTSPVIATAATRPPAITAPPSTADIISAGVTSATVTPTNVTSADVTSIAVTSTSPETSRQRGQHRDCQPDLNPVNLRFCLVHTGDPFAEEMKCAQYHRRCLACQAHWLSCQARQPARIFRGDETTASEIRFLLDFHI